MKLADIVIGGEYAMERRGFSPKLGSELVRVRVLEKTKITGNLYRKGRTDILVEAVDDGVLLGVALLVRRLVVSARAFSASWQAHVVEQAERARVMALRKDVQQQLLAALGTLGLHGERYMRIDPQADVARSELAVSGAELLKLAARAESLVALERLVYRWVYVGDSVEPCSPDGEIGTWAAGHDFSMLDDSERVPSREEIEAEELREAAKYDNDSSNE